MTFLFTDIEGSTRHFRELGEAWPPLLRAHNDLVRTAVEGNGGAVVENEGDGFFVVFADAGDAIRAAAAAQQALMEHPWPTGGWVRARMGVHTGHATPVDGAYVALAVHQASRLAAAGYGGQLLVSESAAAAARAAGCAVPLRLLGEHYLRDFPDPVPVWQAEVPGLPVAFPALRTLSVGRHNLPATRTSFIGRAEDRTRVARLLGHSPVVTLVGPGGVGKTRLAVEVAGDVLAIWPDGVWFVELAAATDAAGVVRAVGDVFGLRPATGQDATDALVASLRSKRALLVLDNCEHLLDPVAELQGRLGKGCPQVAVLATSRERLDVDGEVVWQLEPLTLPPAGAGPDEDLGEAVRLFVERAQAADPRWSLGGRDREAVVALVRHLDGLPLAVELAAAHVTDGPSGAAGVLRQMVAHPGELAGRRGSTPRHRTLDAAIDWSHMMLDAGEQAVFSRLAVFRGGFTPDAAAVVCAGDLPPGTPPVEVLLQRLRHKSLISSDGHHPGRLVLLEPVRDYAERRLAAAGSSFRVLDRLVAWCVADAERRDAMMANQDSASALAALAALDAEQGNVAVALEWGVAASDRLAAAAPEHGDRQRVLLALALGDTVERFWVARGREREVLPLLRRLLPGLAVVGRAALARGEVLVGDTAGRAEQRELARELLTRAAADADAAGDHHVAARARLALIAGHVVAGHADDTTLVALAGLREELAAGDPADVSRCDYVRATAHQVRGEAAEVLALGVRLLTGPPPLDLLSRSQVLNLIGVACTQLGELDRAVAHLDACAALKEAIGDRRGGGAATINRGSVLLQLGDVAGADEAFCSALRTGRDLGHVRMMAVAFVGLGEAAAADSRDERAALLLGAAEAVHETDGLGMSASNRADVDAALVLVRGRLGDAETARLVGDGRRLRVGAAVALALDEPRDPVAYAPLAG